MAEVAKLAAKPIKRQFNYLCCFTSNIDSLKHEAEELDKATTEVQHQVDEEQKNLREAVPDVITWFAECEKMKEEVEKILQEVPNVKEGCLKLGARFSLSRRAKKTTESMKELLVRKNFNPIARDQPRGAAREVPLRKTCEFESRTKLEEQIMTTLKNGDVNSIGICGMGGLGKTTMAERIKNRVLAEHVFEEATLVVVSQQADISKIQDEIGKSLGLKGLQDDSSDVKVQKLQARLTGTGRILLILDDVWDGLVLENLGIPRDSEGCTILVTSRNRDALCEMNVEKIFGMKILSAEEAWFLFRERVGTCVDDAKLNLVARKVVDECDGLPIALITVGAALKDKKDERNWNDALLQLKGPQGIVNYETRVYNSIKLSYDFLHLKDGKHLLLLCCLFAEDALIPLEHLAYICMGLGIFEGIIYRSLEEVRNRISTLTDLLTSRSLLFSDSNYMNKRCVRMHDVVRDVCTNIGKNEKKIGGNDCAWYSSIEQLRERSELSAESEFPKLRLLLLLEKAFEFDSVFLEGIRDLHVLWIKNSTLTSLPHATHLQTLVLKSCDKLKTISAVGELVNLKILICRRCVSLEELPTEIKRSNRLKLLELAGCYRLQSIGRGIISSLVGLEELKMLGSFSKWEAEDSEERKNAGLKELQALTNLTCLEIDIEDPTLVAEDMHISTKLERFHIGFDSPDFPPEGYDKTMSLCLERETRLGELIEMQLLRETEYLKLSGAKNVNFGKCQKMRWLKLSSCDIIDATLLPASLEYMALYSLPQLQEIPISSTLFQNLSSIEIDNCPRLRNIAVLSIAREDCLSQLENLDIRGCEMIEQVLLWKEENNNNSDQLRKIHVKFPKLKKVRLAGLPNLSTFCQGIEGIEFPQLREIYIDECPKWTSMFLSNFSSSRSTADIDDDSSHLFCQPEKVSLGNLKELRMRGNPFCGHEIPVSSINGLEMLTLSGYRGSKSLISSSIATNLANLKRLSIYECDEMVQVVKDEDREDKSRMSNINGGERKTFVFPNLEELILKCLPRLVSFCERKSDVVSPSLRKLKISSCPKMKNFSMAAPNLEWFSTDFDLHLELELGVGVSFGKLRRLSIVEATNREYPFYHHKLFTSLVDRFESLDVDICRSMSLFPYSVAGKFVNLRELQIRSCDEMVKVIEEEAEEKVASGGTTTLLFPKLAALWLSFSPRLVSFCERKCGVELPSLSEVRIDGCRNMKHFSSGPLTTPNLKLIKMDYRDFGGENDLNVVLQQRAKEVPNVKEGCLKLGARFSLSRRAKKTTDGMKELLVRKNFNPIARDQPRGAAREVPLGKTCEFESRTKLEEEIMTTLKNGDVNSIGIWGMGGLGKTTMAERIKNKVLAEHVFKEATMVVVSQQADISKIQDEIGGSLGLKDLQKDSSEVRVQKLHERLTGRGRILLILDDVWEGLVLENLGIPRDSKGCTILVTSRNMDAFCEMNVEKVFGMEILSAEEAWFLFREIVGTCVDDAKLNPVARKVVDECNGLPIALITVGTELKDNKDERNWNDALLQLKGPQSIGNYGAIAYNPIKLSYDFLPLKEGQPLLLLCCLFAKDAEIPLEHLAYICMGLGIFEGITSLAEARNRISTLTDLLTSRSLLFSDSNYMNERCVRMHDVVRDVCKKIGKNEKKFGGSDCAWYSSNEQWRERREFRAELEFPNLRLLLWVKAFEFDSIFLERIRDLHVLWIKSSLLTSLPHTTNLQTLVLESCDELKTISVVGELVNLKILICRRCVSLEELPTEIKRSNRLKLLELAGCYRLQSIGRGIISSLVGLEELKMLGSFSKWEAEDSEERKNAGLKELQALTNLTCLEIDIEDPTLVAEDMHISTKLERFHIGFDSPDFPPEGYDKKMSLCLERETRLGDWIEMQLLRETEYLRLSGNGTKNVNFGKCQKMRWLKLSSCDIVDATLFPASLEYMELYSLLQLQEISISSILSQNLSSIEIRNCNRLRNIAVLSIAGEDCLSQLEKLDIRWCEMIEQVLLWKEENKNNSDQLRKIHVKFPKLKEVQLEGLPNLSTFCQGIEGIEFPQLREIYIKDCPKWTSMYLFCQPEKVSLGNLKELCMTENPFCGHEIPVSSFNGLEMLTLSGYHGSKSLISSSIATNLANLKRLSIYECDEMVQVVKDEDREDKSRMSNINGGERKTLLFPKLEELILKCLPRLVSFCERKSDVVSPSLLTLEISSCPKMKNFSIAAPNLEWFSTDFDLHLELELGVGVSFDGLKALSIVEATNREYPFYHDKLFTSLVDRLESLDVDICRSMSLFPYSVARKLGNLRELRINSCLEMVKVIEEEAEEKVASGGTRTLLFPKLELLWLHDSPKLVSFCERKCGVELPSLSEVRIDGCRNMKHFSSGPLTAPNLKLIYMDFHIIDCENLNVVLQQRAKKKEEEEKEEEKKQKEGGEEAQESKGEIEEERS